MPNACMYAGSRTGSEAIRRRELESAGRPQSRYSLLREKLTE